MVLRAKLLTPEALLSAPRRGDAVPNEDGTHALYTKSTYSFETKETAKEIRILDLKSGECHTLTDNENAHDASWIPGTSQIIWLQNWGKGNTDIMIDDGHQSYKMDTIEAPFSDLKLAPLHDGIAITFSGWADEKGSLYNHEIAEKPASTGRIYDTLNVRFWDTYCDPKNRTVIWYSKLIKNKNDKRWELAAPVHNAMKGTELESPFPYNPLGGGASNYHVSASGIVFAASDPASAPDNVLVDTYFVPLSSFIEEKAPRPRMLSAPGSRGRAWSPRFSPCGKRVLFLLADQNRSQNTRLMFVPDITSSDGAMDLISSASEPWDIIPAGAEWSKDGKSIFVTADQTGRVSIFHVSLTARRDLRPRQLTDTGVVSSFYEIGNSTRLLVSSSSIIDPMTYSIVDISATHEPLILFSSSQHGSKLAISSSQVSEIYFEGAGDYCVHAWVVKPPHFDSSKKYPLAFLIHGGPEDAWRDSWSTRWNPAAWAAQGYVCVLPNPTGSVGYGLDFTEGIYNSWGGRPYEDLVRCFEYVEENMSYVDTDNAIAAGASYGGYMANWIQGQPLGRKFKTIVCHDGVFNILNFLAGDMIGGTEDFGGSMLPWKNHKNLNRWNPCRPELLANWQTPMLIIHSDRDYRCLIEDGLAAFGTCQAKGVPSRYLTFPDEGHWVLKPENSLLWHTTVFDWINKYSGITAKREEEATMALLRSDELLHHDDLVPSDAPVPPQPSFPRDLWSAEPDLQQQVFTTATTALTCNFCNRQFANASYLAVHTERFHALEAAEAEYWHEHAPTAAQQ